MSHRSKQIVEIFKSPKDLILLFRIGAWVVLQPLLIHTMGMRRIMRLLTPNSTATRVDPALEEKIVRYTYYFMRQMPQQQNASNTESNSELNPQGFCLKRSMVLFRFLRLYGKPVQFNLGVRKVHGKLVGHSWIELDGKYYFPDEQTGYKCIFSYPANEQDNSRI